MKDHLGNAVFGALDYIAYPAGMLLLAPAILRSLGIDRYGIWALASAVLMTGAILASGFGDANIRTIAQARGNLQSTEVIQAVRSTLGIHLVLGFAIGCLCWAAAPALALHTVKTHAELFGDCLWSLRITAAIILLRAIETVCVSTQRAFSRYDTAIQVSVTARVLSLLIAWLMPRYEKHVASVMAATLAVNALALWIQNLQLKRLLGIKRLVPSLQAKTTRRLLGFGTFTWLQAVTGLLFGQVDRLIAGVTLGTSAVAVYTFCTQLSQPIYGIAAAGLHFLFPHLASDAARSSRRALLRPIAGALVANFCFVTASLAILLLYGITILRLWAGPAVAHDSASVLPAAAWSAALSALSVTGSYSMLALDRPRTVTILSILGGISMAAALTLLVPHYGLPGIALSRLLPGTLALLIYLPLAAILMKWPALPNPARQHAVDEDVKAPADLRRCANVLGISVDAIDVEGALSRIDELLQSNRKGYVCAVDVNGVLSALHNCAVADVYEHAALALPDGTPTAWVGRAQGFWKMRTVTGPEVMQQIFCRMQFTGYSHFFYGGKPGVTDELTTTLCRQHPWTKVAGTYTPPFRDLTSDEEAELIATIDQCRPDIIWVGIGAPRQELFMRRMLPRLNTRLMFGVGAAFDFLSGRVRMCPPWMKRAGLHWLHRLTQDPRRLWRRNLRNTAFLWHIALQMTGMRAYKTVTAAHRAEHTTLSMDQTAQQEVRDGAV